MTTTILCTLLILAGDSQAQTGVSQGDAAEVFRADFEPLSDINFDGWPDKWTRRRGAGYPTYIPVEIVAIPGVASGRQSLRIRMDGGAVQVFSPPIPVSSQFSYLLQGSLRIEGLRHGSVAYTVSFYDAQDKLLESFESQPISKSTDWMQIELGPLIPQSDQVRTAILSIHVRPGAQADLNGVILVDDIVLSRLPKISLQTNQEYNVFTNPDDVTITCRVSGFTQSNPPITFELRDVHGRVIEVSRKQMEATHDAARVRNGRSGQNATGPDSGFIGSASWKPAVTSHGFYTVHVSTPEHAGLSVQLVVIPPLPSSKFGEFGWSLPEGDAFLPIRTLPGLLHLAGVRWAKFPVWFTANEPQRGEELAWFAERLSTYDIQLVGVLDQPPQEVKEFFGGKSRLPAATIFDDKAVWHPALNAVMTRLSLKVQWWQLGHDEDISFSSYPDLNAKLREIRDDLTRFGQQVHVGVPWRIWEEPPPVAQPSWSFLSYIEDLPPDRGVKDLSPTDRGVKELPLTDAEVQAYLGHESTSRSGRWVVLQPLSRNEYDLETRAKDLVMRMLGAKISRANGVFIRDPFHPEYGLMNRAGSPTEMFLPWRTAATLLSGGEYIGSLRLPHGSENHIFVHGDRATMVVWNDMPTTESIYLGDQIQLFDLWGRESHPSTNHDGELVQQEIPVGPLPTIITGIDAAVAKWRMGFAFETKRLASVFGREQIVHYHFKNTFPQGIGGRVTINVPPVWRTDGESRQFKLAANEERRDAFRVRLGPDTNTGLQPIRVDIQVVGDRVQNFSIFEELQVGLGDVDLELETRLDEKGNLVVEQHLMNNTDKLISFNCMLFVPDRRREKRQVFQLGRGRATNLFVLPNGHELIGKTLWLRAEELGGSRMLNTHIVAHE